MHELWKPAFASQTDCQFKHCSVWIDNLFGLQMLVFIIRALIIKADVWSLDVIICFCCLPKSYIEQWKWKSNPKIKSESEDINWVSERESEYQTWVRSENSLTPIFHVPRALCFSILIMAIMMMDDESLENDDDDIDGNDDDYLTRLAWKMSLLSSNSALLLYCFPVEISVIIIVITIIFTAVLLSWAGIIIMVHCHRYQGHPHHLHHQNHHLPCCSRKEANWRSR